MANPTIAVMARGIEDGNSQGHYHGNGNSNGTGTTWTVTVRAGDPSELHWKLGSTEPLVRLRGHRGQRRELLAPMAGRVETGRHPVGDPAMGLADRVCRRPRRRGRERRSGAGRGCGRSG
ncbi:hypothetical protein VL15_13470 [Burkholderia cepacia]|uniref:Uncharacterized protein n=1 Tax=Burkholderia cepacia TaxID=292 RepID=A0A0J5X578_BURCE|nr:hypothetical protein VL15_13470 [Burkholderia cepacia]